jgi:hypothetical protein
MVYAQVRQRPTDLGGPLAINWTADLGGQEIVAAAVGIETQRQTMRREDLDKARNVEAVPSSGVRNAE